MNSFVFMNLLYAEFILELLCLCKILIVLSSVEAEETRLKKNPPLVFYGNIFFHMLIKIQCLSLPAPAPTGLVMVILQQSSSGSQCHGPCEYIEDVQNRILSWHAAWQCDYRQCV